MWLRLFLAVRTAHAIDIFAVLLYEPLDPLAVSSRRRACIGYRTPVSHIITKVIRPLRVGHEIIDVFGAHPVRPINASAIVWLVSLRHSAGSIFRFAY